MSPGLLTATLTLSALVTSCVSQDIQPTQFTLTDHAPYTGATPRPVINLFALENRGNLDNKSTYYVRYLRSDSNTNPNITLTLTIS